MSSEIRRRVRCLEGVAIPWLLFESAVSLYAASSSHNVSLVAFGGKSLVDLLSAGSCSSFIWSEVVPQEGANGEFIGDQYAQTQNHRAYLARWRHPDDQRSGGRFSIRRLDRAVSLACRVTDSGRDVRQDLRPAVWPPNLRPAGEFLAESTEKSDGGPAECGDEVRRNS